MMKKIFFLALTVALLTGCGVGSYTVSTGKADEGYLSFTSSANTNITVIVDGASYDLKAVKDKAYKTDRKIKKTAQNTLTVTPGTHDVTVMKGGNKVYGMKLFISAQEHKIVEL